MDDFINAQNFRTMYSCVVQLLEKCVTISLKFENTQVLYHGLDQEGVLPSEGATSFLSGVWRWMKKG